LGKALDRSSIFNPVAEELAQDMDLLPRQELWWEKGQDDDEIGYCSGTDLFVFIVDIVTQGLDELDEGRFVAF